MALKTVVLSVITKPIMLNAIMVSVVVPSKHCTLLFAGMEVTEKNKR